MKNKVLSLLGIANRGRNLVSGEFMTEKTTKSGKAFLVIVARDASDNTRKMFFNMCQFYKVPYFEFGTKEELGHSIGKEMRASLAVTDEGLANAIKKQLQTITASEITE